MGTAKNQNSGSQAGGSGKGAAAKGDAKKKDVQVVTGKPVKGAQRIEVRHILCAKSSKWDEAYKKLSAKMTVGNFAIVAREYNEDKLRPEGKLGIIGKGERDPAFETVAFGLQASDESKSENPAFVGVAHTPQGHHIIMVTKRL